MTMSSNQTGGYFGSAEHAAVLTRGRHQGVQTAIAWLAFSHLPERLQEFAQPFYVAGIGLVRAASTDSAELTTALNKLVEAKDWAVRAGIRSLQGIPGPAPRPGAIVDAPVFAPVFDERLRPIHHYDDPKA